MNTPGQNANAVAELVFALLLFTVRNRFNGASGTELKDKKLGLLAYGNTGRNVARIAKGIGMDIYAYDPFTPAEVMQQEGVHPVASQRELFSTCTSPPRPRRRAPSAASWSACCPRRGSS